MPEWGLLDQEQTPFYYCFSGHRFCLHSRLSAKWYNVECFAFAKADARIPKWFCFGS
jgi:hypothetical protein